MGSTVREAVFGIEDGIVSTLGALVGIAAGSESRYVVILSGFVIVAVEALSMAAGSFLSSKSERDIAQRYLTEEAWEIEHDPQQETQELVEHYSKRGFTKKETDILVARVTSDKKLWLEEMAYHELKIIPGELENPFKNGLIMGFSYIAGGLLPLLSYFVLPLDRATAVSVAVSVIALFFVGIAITRITRRSWWKSGMEMVIISLSAAALGYFIGSIAEVLVQL